MHPDFLPASGAAYPFPVIRAIFRVPAPRPYPLALSGVETPVNLALVEATYALESPMELSKRVLIVDDEPIVIAQLWDCFASFEHARAYEITSAGSRSAAPRPGSRALTCSSEFARTA
jgi:hypothetical protein